MVDKYVIIKLETKPYAKTYDDIKEDKFLRVFKLDGSQYPYKDWTSSLDRAIGFSDREDAKKICDLLRINTPYPLKIELKYINS